jgi:hypothetical protein
MSDYKEIINDDFVLKIIPKGSWSPNRNPSDIKIYSIKNQMIDPNYKQSLVERYIIIQTNCEYPGYSHIIGEGRIDNSAEKVELENRKPLRLDDDGTCEGYFKHNQNNSITDCRCRLRFSHAGHNKVLSK